MALDQMNDEDIYTSKLKVNNIDPKTAADNISNANLYEANPDNYVQIKDNLDVDVKSILKVPVEMEQGLKEFVSKSDNHLALAQNDLHKLNLIERRIKYLDDKLFNIHRLRNQNHELYQKQWDGTLTDTDRIDMEDQDEILTQMENRTYGIDGDIEKLVYDVASGFGDMARAYTENWEIIAATTIAGVATGAAAGFLAGPGGVAIGAKAFGRSGFIAGSTVASFKYGYDVMKMSTYKELSNAVEDTSTYVERRDIPLNIDEKTKKQISLGVALISGTVSAASNYVFTKGNPLLTAFKSPRTAVEAIMKSPALLARTKALGHVLQSAIAEGTEEAIQEYVQIVGVALGKIDDSEGSFLNLLSNLPQAISDTATLETAKRAGYVGVVGGLVGGSAAGISGLLSFNKSKQSYETQQNRYLTLQKANQLTEVAAALNSTELNEASPAEAKSYVDSIFKLVAGKDAYFMLEDINKLSENPETRAILEKELNLSEGVNAAAAELNTPITLADREIVNIVQKVPEFIDYLRITPDGESTIEIRTQAQEQMARIEKARNKQEEILASLDGEYMTVEQQAEIQAILDPEVEQADITSEEDYINDIKLQPIEGIISQEEVDVLNNIDKEARLSVAESLKSDVEKKFKTSENKITRDVLNKKRVEAAKGFVEEYATIDKFKEPDDGSNLKEALGTKHKKPGFSAYAIDPKSLPEGLKEIYAKNPVLKKRKVFVEGGMHIDETASLLGFDNNVEMLRVLAETPSKADIKLAITESAPEVRAKVQETIQRAKNDAIDKAFSNQTRAALRKMKVIASKNYPTVKRGVIKIVSKLPSVEGLNRKARVMINDMPVGKINPKTFEKGYKNSQVKAAKSFLEGKYEQAYKELESAALNSELMKESLIAKDGVSKYQKFWKGVKKKTNQNTLRSAGLHEVMQEYTDVFNLSKLRGPSRELVGFNNWLESQIEDGNYAPVVPQRLSDTSMSASEMTFEQYKQVTEMGQYILHQAKQKNKFYKINKNRTDLATAEMYAKAFEDHLKANPKYDEKKLKYEKIATRNLPLTEKVKRIARTLLTTVNTLKTISAELDAYAINDSLAHDTFGAATKESETFKRGEMFFLESQDRKIIEQYGEQEFENLFREKIFVPEFENIPTLGDGNGNILKTDLLVLQAYMGDEGARAVIPNFRERGVEGSNLPGQKLSIETVQEVLNRTLTGKDTALVQSMLVDPFKRYKDLSRNLQKRTTGVEPEMVQGIPINHKDGSRPGGFYPIERQMESDVVKNEKFLKKLQGKIESFTGLEESHFYAKMRAAEMTNQDRMKQRTQGGTRPLDLDFNNVFDFREQIIHDIAFRETGIDMMKVLRNPETVRNMKAVVGVEKFSTFINSVKDVVSKTSEEESSLHSQEYGIINRMISGLNSFHAVQAIGYRVGSAMIQVDSLKNIPNRIGPKSMDYIAQTAKKFMDNPVLFEHYGEVAARINPDIKFERDGIDHAILREYNDYIPSRTFFDDYNKTAGDYAQRVKKLKSKTVDNSFAMVRAVDRYNKVLATLAISEMFLNGDIEGISLADVEAMSESERAMKMRKVVQQTIDLSLTASSLADLAPIQKAKEFKLLVRYWNDRRATLNTMLATIDKTKIALKAGEHKKAVNGLMTLSFTAGISAAYVTAIRGGAKEALKRLKKMDDLEDAKDIAVDTAGHFVLAPFHELGESIPIFDGMKYAFFQDKRSDYRQISAPAFSVLGNITMGAMGIRDFVAGGIKNAKRGKLKGGYTSVTQQNALLADAGYLIRGFPTNAVKSLMELQQSRAARKTKSYVKDMMTGLSDEIDQFIEVYQDEPKAELLINDLRQYQREVTPRTPEMIEKRIPEDVNEVIKTVMSGDDWSKVNTNTGAAGIYQFTEQRWNEIGEANPELGLTENGRLSKDPKEQNLAMEFSNTENATKLAALQIPINNETLLGSHIFGFDKYVGIYDAEKGENLSDILGKDNPLLKEFKSVKAVREYLRDNVEKNNR